MIPTAPRGYRGLYVGISEVGALVSAERQYAHSDIVTRPWFCAPAGHLDAHHDRRPYWWARDVLVRLQAHGLLRGALEITGHPIEKWEESHHGPLITLAAVPRIFEVSETGIYYMAKHWRHFPQPAERLRMGVLYREEEIEGVMRVKEIRRLCAQ